MIVDCEKSNKYRLVTNMPEDVGSGALAATEVLAAAAGKDHLLSLHKFSTSSSSTSSSTLGVLEDRGMMVVKDTWDSLPPTLTPLSRLAATAKKPHRNPHYLGSHNGFAN